MLFCHSVVLPAATGPLAYKVSQSKSWRIELDGRRNYCTVMSACPVIKK